MVKIKQKASKRINRVTGTKILLKFLKLTKDGEYATVEKSSMPYSRINEQTELIEQVYYYHLD